MHVSIVESFIEFNYSLVPQIIKIFISLCIAFKVYIIYIMKKKQVK